MKILKKRFDVMKKIVLDKKTYDQFVQELRQTRTFSRNHIFAVGGLIHLFSPSGASLQTRSKSLKRIGLELYSLKLY